MPTFVPAYSYAARLRRTFMIAATLIAVLWFAGLGVEGGASPGESPQQEKP